MVCLAGNVFEADDGMEKNRRRVSNWRIGGHIDVTSFYWAWEGDLTTDNTDCPKKSKYPNCCLQLYSGRNTIASDSAMALGILAERSELGHSGVKYESYKVPAVSDARVDLSSPDHPGLAIRCRFGDGRG
jgi:hypothetical protein